MWQRACRSLYVLKTRPKPRPLLSSRLQCQVCSAVGWRAVSTNSSDAPTYQQYHHVEDMDMYEPGGFHPIEVKEELNRRYVIVDKLGHGGYSTIWLARDNQLDKYVAIKIGLSSHTSNEHHILRTLYSVKGFNGQLTNPILDHFSVEGPNGTHSCIVTPPARCNVAEATQSSPRMSFLADTARALCAQLIMATASVHQAGFVHGDIHLRNVLLQLPDSELDHLSVEQVYEKYYPPDPNPVVRTDGQPVTSPSVPKNVYTPNYFGKPSDEFSLAEARLWLIDFGTAFDPAQETRTLSFTHRQNQPPEAKFETTKPLTFSSDIWSLGLMVWEIMGSGPFMSGFLWDSDEVIGDQVDALGPLPQEWWDKWDARSKEFTEDGQPKEGRGTRSFQQRFDSVTRETGANKNTPRMDEEESHAFKEMILGMLRFRPEERLAAAQILRSDWMTRWAIPKAEEVWGRKLLDE